MSEGASGKSLLTIVELGGYPNFDTLYRRLGYRHEVVNTGRRAISLLKKSRPDVLVTEFHYQFAFRDRTSSLESILAVVQGQTGTRVIVLYDEEQAEQLEKVHQRFPGFETLAYPLDEAKMEACLTRSS